MSRQSEDFVGYLYKVPACAFVFAMGLIVSRIILYSMGAAVPRMPQQAPEAVAPYYLIVGSLILTIGLFPLFRNIGGSYPARFLTIFVFLFATFGVSDSLESSIYSDVEDAHDLMAVVLFLPVLLFTLTFTSLTKPESDPAGFVARWKGFFGTRSWGQWLQSAVLAVLAFPLVYFVFGIMVSPFVSGYYQQADLGLALPSPGTILAVQLIRSLLFLLVTLPVLVLWNANRTQLVLFLGTAHFVIVFSYDIVLAYQLPASLLLTHAVEILLDSLVYSWILVRLFHPGETAQELPGAGESRAAGS